MNMNLHYDALRWYSTANLKKKAIISMHVFVFIELLCSLCKRVTGTSLV